MMLKLLLIADDFTGALDTGIQFAEYGADTKMIMLPEIEDMTTWNIKAEVLIVDLETRHMKQDEAYRAVYNLVHQAKNAKVPYIYKKTDSGLRGNIGRELRAVLDASGEMFLPFVPALPEMDRITVNGIQYIDGKPIDESVFGDDLFEPVKSPYVWDLFRSDDTPIRLFPVQDSYDTAFQQATIGIFDANKQEDVWRIAKHLNEKGQLSIMAGCAGLAAVLPEFLQIKKRDLTVPELNKPLLIACGSINPITRKQIEFGEKVGYDRIIMTPRQQLEEGYLETEEGKRWMDTILHIFEKGKVVMIDTGISNPEMARSYIEKCDLPLEEARVKISDRLGKILKELMERKNSCTLMIIGGDTLKGFVDQIHCKEITPICQVEPGTVLSSVETPERKFWVISKSGGFGKDNLLQSVAEKVLMEGSD